MNLTRFVSSLHFERADQRVVKIVEGLLWMGAVAGLTTGAQLALGPHTVDGKTVFLAVAGAALAAIANGMTQLTSIPGASAPVPPPTSAPPLPGIGPIP